MNINFDFREKEQEVIDLLEKYEKIVERCDENESRIVGQQERKKLILDNVEEHRRRKEKQEIEEKEQLEAAEK